MGCGISHGGTRDYHYYSSMDVPMKNRSVLSWLYLLNAAVLITHEIDSAYWHEWDLFGVPGGIQIFLILNLCLIVAVMYGHKMLLLERVTGTLFSWLLALSGLFAASVHTAYILNGSTAFLNATSIMLLVATAILSAVQAIFLWKL